MVFGPEPPVLAESLLDLLAAMANAAATPGAHGVVRERERLRKVQARSAASRSGGCSNDLRARSVGCREPQPSTLP